MKVEDFVDPYLGQTWQSLGARVLSSGKRISVTLGYPAQGMQAKLTEQLSAFLGVDDIELDISFSVSPGSRFWSGEKCGVGEQWQRRCRQIDHCG